MNPRNKVMFCVAGGIVAAALALAAVHYWVWGRSQPSPTELTDSEMTQLCHAIGVPLDRGSRRIRAIIMDGGSGVLVYLRADGGFSELASAMPPPPLPPFAQRPGGIDHPYQPPEWWRPDSEPASFRVTESNGSSGATVDMILCRSGGNAGTVYGAVTLPESALPNSVRLAVRDSPGRGLGGALPAPDPEAEFDWVQHGGVNREGEKAEVKR